VSHWLQQGELRGRIYSNSAVHLFNTIEMRTDKDAQKMRAIYLLSKTVPGPKYFVDDENFVYNHIT